jgi:hypothetical protein
MFAWLSQLWNGLLDGTRPVIIVAAVVVAILVSLRLWKTWWGKLILFVAAIAIIAALPSGSGATGR